MTDRASNPPTAEDNAADPARVGGISLRLAQATRDLHRQAERTGIVARLLRQDAGIDGYAMLLRNLLPVYRTMEESIQLRRDLPGLEIFAPRGLARAGAIHRDLCDISGPDYEQALPVLPGGERYAERVAQIARTEPERLIGHAYTRYFGDLSGGRILKNLISSSLPVPSQAVRFFEFPKLRDPDNFVAHARGALDRTVSDPATADRICDEAVMAFELNIGLSVEIAATAG